MSQHSVDSLGDLDDSDWDALEEAVRRFEDSWRTGKSPDLSRYLPDRPAGVRQRALLELVKVDSEYQLQAGHLRPVEVYLDSWPELRVPEATIELLEAECHTRATFGQPATSEELVGRFRELAQHIDCERIAREAVEGREESILGSCGGSAGEEIPMRPSTWRPLPIGFRVGRYEIVGILGAGGMAWVYHAHDNGLNRDVALKVPRFSDQECVDRFVQEGRAAASIDHPHVCRVFDAGEIDGVSYIAMALIDGMTLNERLENGPLDPREAAEIACKVATAVEVVHAEGILHRDVKPSNVMIQPNGEPVLMDFGLARTESDITRLSQTGSFLGTLPYMAPEQLTRKPTDRRSDIYSLGLVLYHMLAGKLPHSADTLLKRPRPAGLQSPQSIAPDIDDDLETICTKALAARPEDRFQTAAEMAEALRHYLEGSPLKIRRRKRLVNSRPAAIGTVLMGSLIAATAAWFARSPLGLSDISIGKSPETASVKQGPEVIPTLRARWIDIDRVHSFCLSADDATLYVGSQVTQRRGDGSQQIENPVLAIDVGTGARERIAKFPSRFDGDLEMTHAHRGMVLSSDASSLYTNNYYFAYVSQLRLGVSETKRRRDIEVTNKPPEGGWRWSPGIALSADGSKLIVPLGKDGKPVDFDSRPGGFHNDQVSIVDLVDEPPELVAEVLLPDEPCSREIGVRDDFAYIVTEPRDSASPTLYEVRVSPPYEITRSMTFPDESMLTSIAVSEPLGRAFVADEQGRRIHVVDLADWEVVDLLEIEGMAPRALTIDHSGTTLAVVSTQSRTLSVVDAASGEVQTRASDLRPGVIMARFSHGGSRVFVGSAGPNGGIGVIDLADIPAFDRIVFSSDRGSQPPQIYVAGLHADEATQVTDNRAANRCPSWSPDGERIAFLSQESGSAKVHKVDRYGNNGVIYANTAPLFDDSPGGPAGAIVDWSPEGRHIAFIAANQMAIRAVDVATMEVTTLFDATTDADASRSRIMNLCWAENGRLYFGYCDFGDDRNLEVFSLAPDGESPVTQYSLVDGPARIEAPTVAFDGRVAAVYRPRLYDPSAAIYLLEGSGSDLEDWQRLSPTRLHGVHSPKWFPDGRRLAFSADLEGRRRLHILETESGWLRWLTTEGWKIVEPASSPSEEKPRVSGNWSDAEPDIWSAIQPATR